MSITTVNNNTNVTQSSNDKVYNPKSMLDESAFMKLFLKQLEMQDPTDPMDTDKMLEETAQLADLETNTKMKDTLDQLSSVLNKSSELSAISAIGKMADTGNRYIDVTDKDTSKSFDLYFGEDFSNATVLIEDKQGNIVKTINLGAHTKGVLNFDWDLKNDEGQRVKSDTYKVVAKYTTPQGKELTTELGAYPIEAVRFDDGKVYAKLGSQYVPFDEIKQIYEWEE
jgi:flagellar basal-body rod modification protein FlgD